MKFIFPTVADSWSDVAAARRGDLPALDRAAARPARPTARGQRALGRRLRAGAGSLGRVQEPTGRGRRGILAGEPGPSRPAPRGAAGCHPGCTRRYPNSAPEPQAPHGTDSVSPAAPPADPEGADLLGPGTAAEGGDGAGVWSGSDEGRGLPAHLAGSARLGFGLGLRLREGRAGGRGGVAQPRPALPLAAT